MNNNNPIVKYQELAREMCEDWKPVAQWECTEIETIWFTRQQLNQFIKHIIDNEKRKNEK